MSGGRERNDSLLCWMRETAELARQAPRWRKPNDLPPRRNHLVIIAHRTRNGVLVTSEGQYLRRFEAEADPDTYGCLKADAGYNNYACDGCDRYDARNDRCCVPEGWHRYIENTVGEIDYEAIDCLAWCEKPAPPEWARESKPT